MTNAALAWAMLSESGKYPAAHMGPKCAGCESAAPERHLHGKGKLCAVVEWHSLQSAVQDGPPYRRAFRLPFPMTANLHREDIDKRMRD